MQMRDTAPYEQHKILSFLGLKLCASTADITGRPFPTAVSQTPVRFVCANLQNLSFCQCAIAAELVCRNFDFLINQQVTIIFHTYCVHHNLFRFTAYVNLYSVNYLCVTVCVSLFPLCYCVHILLCCCSSVILCSLYGSVSVVASWLTTSNKNSV
jgi:hypothetical protein